ncbi:uncharacterized protein LOC111910595 [Lactuca sativa]|uniref:uncharacterized protein LOC111910595 n=1 Tax=Lactuca sativa TaxID=4236 RepID=UPI000CD80349|nr:uncharacterized protein LOC111910595 [Lactuca sativa]
MTDNTPPGGSSSNTNPSSDPNSPFYIHPTDYPRQVHVNENLGDNNYANRSMEMKDFLLEKNRVGFIDGTIAKPTEGKNEYRVWQRIDALIKGWPTIVMEKNIRNSVKYATTTKEIWDDLEERFGKESTTHSYELKCDLTTLKQEADSVSTYFTKMRAIWDEIFSVSPTPTYTCGNCTCDIGKRFVESRDKERVYEFPMGLKDTFKTIKTKILSTKPMPLLGSTYHLVSEDEQHRNISTARKPNVDASTYQMCAQIPPTRTWLRKKH